MIKLDLRNFFNLAKNLCKLRETDRKFQHVGNLGLTYSNDNNTLLFQIFIFPIHIVYTITYQLSLLKFQKDL